MMIQGSVKSHVKQTLPSLVIMLLMIGAASMASTRFFTAANLRNVLTQTAVLAVASVAQCLVLLIGGIDMSVSSVISFGTIALAMLSGKGGGGLLIGILLAFFVGAVTGLINGIGVMKLRIPAMIITISTQAFLKGICLILMPSSGGKVNQGFVHFIKTRFGIFSVAFLTAIILYVVFFIVLHYSQFGRRVYAVGNGAVCAEQSGIPVKRVTVAVYVVSGLIASLAGILLSARISSGNPLVGDSYAMDSIAAAVIGGISMNGGVGSILGALFGAIILSLINNIMNSLGISPYYQYIIKGLLLLFSLLLFQLKRRSVIKGGSVELEEEAA